MKGIVGDHQVKGFLSAARSSRKPTEDLARLKTRLGSSAGMGVHLAGSHQSRWALPLGCLWIKSVSS